MKKNKYQVDLDCFVPRNVPKQNHSLSESSDNDNNAKDSSVRKQLRIENFFCKIKIATDIDNIKDSSKSKKIRNEKNNF